MKGGGGGGRENEEGSKSTDYNMTLFLYSVCGVSAAGGLIFIVNSECVSVLNILSGAVLTLSLCLPVSVVVYGQLH